MSKKVMWQGPEHVRVIRRGDLGVHPEDDSELVWSAETHFTQEVDDAEYDALKNAVGGNWALVVEDEAPVASTDESSSDQKKPQAASSKS